MDRRKSAAACALIVIVAAAVFARALAGSSLLGLEYTDGAKQGYFWKLFYQRTLLEGHLPLWYPHILMGIPYLGNPLTAALYPPSALFVALPVERAYNVFLALHLALAGVGMFVLARQFELSRAAALLAGVTFMLNANLVGYAFGGLHAEVATIAWMPFALWAFARALAAAGSRRVTWTLVLGVILALQILAGHPQRVFFTGLILGLYGIWYGWRRDGAPARGISSGLLLLAGASFLAVLLAAVQALPSWEAMGLSRRGPPASAPLVFDSETFKGSFHPVRLVTFVIPDLFGDAVSLAPVRSDWLSVIMDDVHTLELQAYVGLLPLILAALSWRHSQLAVTRFLWLLVIGGFVLAIGRYGLVYPILHWLVPPLQTFRVPARFLSIVAFGLALLAGCGLHAILERRDPAFLRACRRTGTWLLIGAAVLAATAFAAVALRPMLDSAASQLVEYLYVVKQRGQRQPLASWLTMIPAASSLVVTGIAKAAALGIAGGWLLLLRSRDRIAPRHAAAILLGLTLADVGWFAWRYTVTTSHDTLQSANTALLAPALHGHGLPGRVLTLYGESDRGLDQLLAPSDNAVVAAGLSNFSGYESMETFPYMELREAMARQLADGRTTLLDMANVRWVISRSALAMPGARLAHDGPIKVYENTTAQTRAWICYAYRTVATDRAALAALEGGEIDPRQFVVVAGGAAAAPGPNGSTRGCDPLQVSMPHGGEYVVEVRAEEPGMVVLSDMFYPGWTAYVDDRPTPVTRVDYCLKGVEVPAGSRRVAFRYEPQSFRRGTTISGVSLAGTAIAFAVAFGGRRRA